MKTKKPRWPKPKKFFKTPIYAGSIYLFRSQEKYIQACAFLRAPEPDLHGVIGKAQELQNTRSGELVYLIGCFDDQQSTLVHEASHLAFFILQTAGIDARDSGGETFCYLLQALLNKLGMK